MQIFSFRTNRHTVRISRTLCAVPSYCKSNHSLTQGFFANTAAFVVFTFLFTHSCSHIRCPASIFARYERKFRGQQRQNALKTYFVCTTQSAVPRERRTVRGMFALIPLHTGTSAAAARTADRSASPRRPGSASPSRLPILSHCQTAGTAHRPGRPAP